MVDCWYTIAYTLYVESIDSTTPNGAEPITRAERRETLTDLRDAVSDISDELREALDEMKELKARIETLRESRRWRVEAIRFLRESK